VCAIDRLSATVRPSTQKTYEKKREKTEERLIFAPFSFFRAIFFHSQGKAAAVVGERKVRLA
jgi:hypothetical protein